MYVYRSNRSNSELTRSVQFDEQITPKTTVTPHRLGSVMLYLMLYLELLQSIDSVLLLAMPSKKQLIRFFEKNFMVRIIITCDLKQAILQEFVLTITIYTDP